MNIAQLTQVSDPKEAQRKATAYLGKGTKLLMSSRSGKKYMVWNPKRQTYVHFGDIHSQDYTKHKDDARRKSYLARSGGIRGNWRRDRYSANNLARNILW